MDGVPDLVVEQKRLEIARALASESEILLLDEPAAGLTIRETEAMGDLVISLKERGKTNRPRGAQHASRHGISDWLVVLHHGQKSGGTPEAIQKDRRVIEAYLGA